jgi:predicted amidohydrolase
MVVGGSAWWTVEDAVSPDAPQRLHEREIMKATPGTFARMLGVPVIHAAHAGRFAVQDWPHVGVPYASHYLGEAQIVDGKGGILARMLRDEGEGVITADISFGRIAEEPAAIPDRYWIAEFSEELYREWESELKSGHEYYLSTTLPSAKRRFGRSPPKQAR